MNPTQYDLLTNTIQPEPQLANAKLLYAQDPRTLIYGYTGEKSTFHVYLNGGVIHKVVYDFSGHLLSHKSQSDGLLFSECVPDKRIYPETCDFEFCSLLKRRGVSLPFYNWNDKRERAAFYGKRLEELQEPAPTSHDLDIPVDAEGWNLNPLREESDMAAAILGPKLKDLLLAARAASLVTVEEAIRIRDVMYVEMDVYEHLGARDAAAEWMLVSLIECALGLPTQTVTR
jgi:hypothetical protein